MEYIRQLLDVKGRGLWSVGPDDTVFAAIELMACKRVGALAVLENEKLVGIISERDYARKVILKHRASRETKVREIMSDKVVCVHECSTINECMTLMSGRGFRHLPVTEGDDNHPVAMISTTDLVRSIISNQKSEIEQLKHYILG